MWMLKRHRKEREKLDDVLRLPLWVRVTALKSLSLQRWYSLFHIFFLCPHFHLTKRRNAFSCLFFLSLSFVSQYFWVTQGVVPSLRWPWICCYFTILSVYFWSMHKILILLSISLPLVLSSSVRDSNILAYQRSRIFSGTSNAYIQSNCLCIVRADIYLCVCFEPLFFSYSLSWCVFVQVNANAKRTKFLFMHPPHDYEKHTRKWLFMRITSRILTVMPTQPK